MSLSASNCPSGANCTFNPSSVVPTNDSVLSIYDAPVGGPYTITISATGGGKTHDTSVTLTVNEEEGEGEGGGGGGENTIPNDPINLAQFEDAGALTESQSTDDTTPYFTFDVSDPDTNDIIGYQIQIDNDSNFSSPIIDFEYIDDDITPQSFVYQVPSTCPGSGYIACTTPLTDENYYWQVRAKDNGGEYSYWVEFGTEEVIDFIVNTVVVGAPTAEFSACRVAGNAILFFDESTDVGGTIDEWDWDFGDETSHSSLQNPQHDYDTGDTSMLDGATRIAGAKEVRGEEENKKLRNEEIEENKNIQIQKKQKKSVFKKAWEFIKNLFKTKKSSADSWWDENWTKRRKIVFNNSSSSENLNNVPVLVVLNSGNIDYGQTQDNGEDIRFVDSNDSTELNYEIEDWNESGNSYVWVKVPRVNKNSNSDFIYIYYGNNSASDNQNKTSVWNNDYGLVWHMEGDGTIISDSSGNRSDTTLLNTWTWNSGGKISDTLYMMSRPINTGIWPRSTGIYDGSDLTLSFWVKGISSAPTSNWADQFVVTSGRWSGLTIGNQGNPPDPYIKFTDYNNGAGRDLNTTYFGNSGFDLYTLSIDWNGGSGDDARFWLYKNGSLVDTFDQEQDSYPGMIYLGTEEDLAQSGTYVDEFRISETVRSGEWIEAQYRIMTNSFNSFEDEESTEPTVFNVTLVATDNDSSTDSETKELNLTAMTLDGSDIDDCDFSFDLTNLSSSGCNLVSAEWDLSLIYDESGDYVVDRCTSGCSSFNNYSSISPAKSCSELGCSFDDATTDSNTTYSYIISNPDSLNNSTISPSCNGAQQPSGTICPLSVTTLVCEPESVSTSHVCGSISLQWLEDENVSYDIKRCVGKQSGVECTPEDLLYEFLVEDCAGGVCEYMDEEIIPINIATPADENYYCYGIVGIDGEGLESSMSDIVCDYSYCYRAPNWQEQ